MSSVARRLLTILLPITAGCGGSGSDRQEVISSLRTFGLSASPLVSLPSDDGQPARVVEVTYFGAIPSGLTAKLRPFADTGSRSGALPLPVNAIQVVAGSETYTEYHAFRLFSAKARISIPTATQFIEYQKGSSFTGAQVRYGITVEAGDQLENVIANLDVFAAGAEQHGWQQPTIDIVSPAADETIAVGHEVTLKATPGNLNLENVKVGWFVTTGQVSNRRAATSSWKASTGGPQTIAVVLHGVNSRGFALQVRDVVAK